MSLKKHLKSAAGRPEEIPILFPEPDGRSPRIITDYLQIESTPVGKGSFGTVYPAVTKSGGHAVAVKAIAKESVRDNFQLLINEVRLLRKMNNPCIVKLYDVFENEHWVMLVMEYMAGGELYKRITTSYIHGFPDASAIVIIRRLCEAVGYLHDNDIIHRDIKPENIMYVSPHEDTCIKLSDFGLAKVVDGETIAKTACGSPSYVAPEVLQRLPQGYNKAVDMWSVGVVTYAVCCGFAPFHHQHLPTQFNLILAGQYSFPSPFWDNKSPLAKDFISKLLLINPQERMTARQALQHEWLTQGSAAASPPPPPTPASVTTDSA